MQSPGHATIATGIHSAHIQAAKLLQAIAHIWVLDALGAMQAVSALAQVVNARCSRLTDILAAVNHHAALARQGLRDALADVLLPSMLSLIQARLASGPVQLQRTDPEVIMVDVWRNYFKSLAGSKTPITQVRFPVAVSRALPGSWFQGLGCFEENRNEYWQAGRLCLLEWHWQSLTPMSHCSSIHHASCS